MRNVYANKKYCIQDQKNYKRKIVHFQHSEEQKRVGLPVSMHIVYMIVIYAWHNV